MKTKTILIAAVMFFALTASAFAQATFSVSSIPETTVVNSGFTEKTGDIMFTTVAGTPASVTGTFTISYGVPITAGTTATPSPIAVSAKPWLIRCTTSADRKRPVTPWPLRLSLVGTVQRTKVRLSCPA